MAEPAMRPAAGGAPKRAAGAAAGGDAPPPYDPVAVDRAYLQERARRRARIEHGRARRRASLRFWVVLLVLAVASMLLLLTVWREIERLFGL